MRRIDNRRKKFAWLLLLVYVPMLLAITFHHHSGAEETAVSYCYDCAHHIHHDGHFVSQSAVVQECLLCQLCALSYVVPALVKVALFVAVAYVAFHAACPFVKMREGNVRSTRAPPAF